MTDREEFEKWYKTTNKGEVSRFEIWQARGALDAVRIKELELANKILIGMTDNMANQISEYEVIDKGQLERIKELEAKFEHEQKDCTKKCDIYIATKKQMDYEKNLASAQTEIAELTAKLDKARDGDCCTEGCIKCDARKILAETQEPMIIKQENGMVLKLGYDELPNGTAFYTTPPSREWQSLSKKEVDEIVSYPWGKTEDWVRAIEAKLREKNNG